MQTKAKTKKMNTSVICPHCHNSFDIELEGEEVSDYNAGKKLNVNCPDCKKEVTFFNQQKHYQAKRESGKETLFIVIGVIILLVWLLSFCSNTSDSTTTTKTSSSGKMCTWIKTVEYDTGKETVTSSDCPSGERCVKSSKDLDGDGLLCTEMPAYDGMVSACDGRCAR